MSQPFHRPPAFFRPPRNDNKFGGRMPWGSPRLPVRQQRPPYLRPPFGMSHEGFRLPSHMQAPPMFGPGGATVPPNLMKGHQRGKGPRNNQRQDFMINGDSAKEFWCEACDRGFNTKDMLDKHNGEHQVILIFILTSSAPLPPPLRWFMSVIIKRTYELTQLYVLILLLLNPNHVFINAVMHIS